MPTYEAPRSSVPVPTPTPAVEERDIFAPRKATAPAAEEDRSDFDRFMNDRNSFVANETNEESTVAQTENKQPSRLIQSIRDAANRYENSSAGLNRAPQAPSTSFSGNDVAANTRAKSIAEKLGFVNFDEDEFDTPSYLRKEEKTEQRPATRDFKNLDF
jgi:cell division protein FtsZ